MQTYTCPMHPEVKSKSPGACPKCGMRLVIKNQSAAGDDRGLGNLTWKSYLPLIVIISLILVTSLAITVNDIKSSNFFLLRSVSYFMSGFFLVFSGFKLMDLKGFAQGYSMYDLLAKKVFIYGYIYPFIELSFGLAMIVGFSPRVTLFSEVLVMGFSGIGVLLKVLRNEKFQCVCLGTVLKVPLTNVTLIEDFGMAALALLMLAK